MEEEVRSRLLANAELLEQAAGGAAWQQKVKMAQDEVTQEDAEKKMEADKKKNVPYLSNLNEDPLLSGIIVHFIEKETITIGKTGEKDGKSPDLILNGMR